MASGDDTTSDESHRETASSERDDDPTVEIEVLDPDAGKGWLEQLVPATSWLRSYSSGVRDVVAALVLAVLLLPQSMAYALLADLPPQIGLYAAIIAPLGYLLFGTSRVLSIGPVALVSLLVAEGIAGAVDSQGVDPLDAALVMAAQVGLVLIAGGLLKLGLVTDFLSRPVLDGFTAGAAVLIATSQLRNFSGIDAPRGGSFFQRIQGLVERAGEAHLPTLFLALGCLVILLAASRWFAPLLERTGLSEVWRQPIAKSVPFFVVAGALALTARDLGERGVATVGEVEATMPRIGLPPLDLDLWMALFPASLTAALVAIVTAIAVARSLAGDRRGDIVANREMGALGLANVLTSVFGGYPVGASISRSSVTRDAGAGSPLAAAIAGLLVAGAWIALGGLLVNLPKAALAALIIAAAIGMIDVRGAIATWRFHRSEGFALLGTFAAVLLLGVERGLLTGAFIGLALYLWRTSRPKVVVEGRLGEAPHRFHAADREGVERPQTAPVMVLRVDHSLYFGNARHVRERIVAELVAQPDVRCLVLDLRSVDEIDATALDMLRDLLTDFERIGLTLSLAEMKQPVRDSLRAAGFLDEVGDDHLFLSLDEAVATQEERQCGISSGAHRPEEDR